MCISIWRSYWTMSFLNFLLLRTTWHSLCAALRHLFSHLGFFSIIFHIRCLLALVWHSAVFFFFLGCIIYNLYSINRLDDHFQAPYFELVDLSDNLKNSILLALLTLLLIPNLFKSGYVPLDRRNSSSNLPLFPLLWNRENFLIESLHW